MHIILTHEQADFDAIASLLGAHLLYESARPVLPRRMNRNVHAFLALYGEDLPFVDPRDLRGEPIEMVTLVDTQSMVSLKGMGPGTRVQVIDHHPLRDGLPPEWSVKILELGANATLLIEALREQNGLFTPLQATLLLLGIYEDTGSLTYARTTARDLHAAAYLIEQGASLQIASEYLNHPLSQAQQALYDQLRASLEHYHVHGHTIVVVCGDAQAMDEELSTIAHKLRDLLDPDALFLLVTTRGGVQIIARSTSDHIDVSEIVARFGGGGHERAAAALVRERGLEEVHAELVKILPERVRPAITVAQIMSRGPQLLSPATPVEEAARRMQRYGYEGYPVVENGRVVGLLTRRAVDRALAHKLNLTAASLMEAGACSVAPGDSIEHLQRLVTESGWGQIPVVDPASGEIVGIVTRTDLLKTLAPKPRLPGRLNLAAKLESALPSDRLALIKAIAAAAHEQRAALYVVGGFVRDLLLERPSLDFDLVVEGDAIALARALSRRHGGRVTSHARFGTAKWHLDESPNGGPASELTAAGLQAVDLVTARTEFYTYPTALPTVERGSIKLDLHRRDFTINTLALRLDGPHYGELHDYWGGLEDLQSGLVRVLHSLSFIDDPTRILRAVRFEQRFDFKIDDRSLQLLLEARSLIERLSGDRIRHELNHILATAGAPQTLARLHALGLLTPIHPALDWDEWLHERFQALAAAQPDLDWELPSAQPGALLYSDLAYALWLIRLSPETARQVTRRLKLSVKLSNIVLSACALWQSRAGLAQGTPSQVAARLESAPAASRYALYLATDDPQLQAALWNYASQWRKVEPGVDGNDLKALGLPPGPVYRRILDRLRDAWLDDEIHSPAEERAFLDALLENL
ncbi:MAG: CBS domain-containing protein [Anaerolineales bacterium]|nr:CBS domain-containing protein [Anaerolineales bacterium]